MRIWSRASENKIHHHQRVSLKNGIPNMHTASYLNTMEKSFQLCFDHTTDTKITHKTFDKVTIIVANYPPTSNLARIWIVGTINICFQVSYRGRNPVNSNPNTIIWKSMKTKNGFLNRFDLSAHTMQKLSSNFWGLRKVQKNSFLNLIVFWAC